MEFPKDDKGENVRQKFILFILIETFTSAMLTGCGSSGPDTVQNAGGSVQTAETEESGQAEDAGETADDGTRKGMGTADLSYSGNIRIWVEDAIADITQQQVIDFQAQYPGLADASFTIEKVNESETASRMIADVGTGADLYVFTQDQLARLVSAGALEKIAEENVEAAISGNDEGSVAAATSSDTLYAWPMTSDSGYLLYYDAGVVSDPSDLDAILEDCEAAGKNFYMEINSGWYQTAFFFGTGCELSYETDDDGNYVSASVDYASENGMTALKEIIKVASSGAFRNGSSAAEGADIGAIVDGIWDADVIRELFGDNYACAKLPSFKADDGNTYQLSGFSGYRFLGIKPQEEEDKLAVCNALAAFLAGEEAQLARYNEIGWGPSNLEAQRSDEVKEDAALTALYEQMAFDKPQGLYPGDYWSLAASLGDDVITGSLTMDSEDDDLMAALQDFQDTCSSYADAEEGKE